MTTAERNVAAVIRQTLSDVASEHARNRSNTAEQVWLSVDQAARYLKLPSPRALYQAVRRGHVPAHRIGRNLRFLRTELDSVLVGR